MGVVIFHRFVIGFLVFALHAQARSTEINKYLDFMKDYPSLTSEMGNYKDGEIEIVVDEKKIREIEEMQRMRFRKKGMTQEEAFESSRVGIVSEDDYWIWIRDAVIFPTGAEGTFNRLVKKSLVKYGTPGIAVLPLLSDGKVALNLNYRHATRSWQLEIPRGQSNQGESTEDTVARELKEETGLILSQVYRLGEIFPDSGCMSCLVPVYLGLVEKKGLANPDFSEAILRIEAFDLEEVRSGISRGWIEMDIKNKKEKVMIADPFLVYAIFQAEYKNLFKKSSPAAPVQEDVT